MLAVSQLFGGTVLGIGIWMAVDRAFLTFIIGTDLYAVAIYMVLIGGGLVFLFTILGCFGAVTENRCMLWTVGGAGQLAGCVVSFVTHCVRRSCVARFCLHIYD